MPMKNLSRGFTLIELLVVIAIIAILAAILFPVFAQAKAAAYKTQDIASFKQIGTATAMYTADYDGGYFLSNSGGVGLPGWGFGPPDTVPGQQMMPYVKNTLIHVGAVDPNKSEEYRIRDHATDPSIGWNMNNLTPAQRMYALMVRSNVGYNYAFFSPWRYFMRTGTVSSASVNESEVTNPSNTLLFGSSIWDRSLTTGAPIGGGNWVIETPCWETQGDMTLRPMLQYQQDGTLSSYPIGWATPTAALNRNSWLVYGGLWPFHNQVSLQNVQRGLKDGQVIISFADTSTRAKQLKSVTEGCTAYGTSQRKGKVTDFDKFIWDLD